MTGLISSADVSFDPATHEYRLPNGVRLPSVTEVLKATRVAEDFDELRGISDRVAADIDLKRDLGRAIHMDAWAFDDDDLDWSTVDERVEPYLRAWQTFRENTGLKPITRERLVLHAALGYAGTLDGIFEAPNGRHLLVDLKTGDPNDAGCAYQTAAYEAAYRSEHPDAIIDGRWGVQLTPEHGIPYRVSPYTDWQDFLKFQAFLTTYHHQAARRRRVV